MTTTTTTTVAEVREAMEETLRRMKTTYSETEPDHFQRAYAVRFKREVDSLIHWTSPETNEEGALDDDANVLWPWVKEAYREAYRELAKSITGGYSSAIARLEVQAEARAANDFAEALERAIEFGGHSRGTMPTRP